jgi:uncharacterized membrane protein YccC
MPDDDSSAERAAPPGAAGPEPHIRSAWPALALGYARDAARALVRELAAWRAPRERVAFAAQATLSVALAVALARALHLPNTWWAAISGFAVMQDSLAGSARRGLHRVLGTVLGGLVGVLVGPSLGGLPWLFVPVLGVIGGVSVYRAIGSDTSYAWILGAVTALMVAFDARLQATLHASAAFAALRVAEVIVGTFACVLVSALFHVWAEHRDHAWFERSWAEAAPMHCDWLARVLRAARGRLRSAGAGAGDSAGSGASSGSGDAVPPGAPAQLGAARVATLEPASFRAARRRLALQSGVSIAILAALAWVVKLPSFAQAMVTTIAVVALPAAALAEDTTHPVLEKMVQRLVGCLLAGAVALALLPLLRGDALACMLTLGLGVWAGSHLQTGKEGASYVGRQFTIAFIMVFVQDHRWSADPMPALVRFAGILSGVVVIGGVMLASAPRGDGATHRA